MEGITILATVEKPVYGFVWSLAPIACIVLAVALCALLISQEGQIFTVEEVDSD